MQTSKLPNNMPSEMPCMGKPCKGIHHLDNPPQINGCTFAGKENLHDVATCLVSKIANWLLQRLKENPISNKTWPALNTTSHTIYCILFVREEGLTYGMTRWIVWHICIIQGLGKLGWPCASNSEKDGSYWWCIRRLMELWCWVMKVPLHTSGIVW
jgi:hypothetical protein